MYIVYIFAAKFGIMWFQFCKNLVQCNLERNYVKYYNWERSKIPN